MKQSNSNNQFAFKVTTNQFNDGTSTAIIKDDVLICSEVDKNIIDDAPDSNYLIEHSKNGLMILSRSKRLKDIDTNIQPSEINKAYIIEQLKRDMKLSPNN